MPELTRSLLEAYSHFAARDERHAGLLLAAALAYELGGKAEFARAAVDAFLDVRAFYDEDVKPITRVRHALSQVGAGLFEEVRIVAELTLVGGVRYQVLSDGARCSWDVWDGDGRHVAGSQPAPISAEQAEREAALAATAIALRHGRAKA